MTSRGPPQVVVFKDPTAKHSPVAASRSGGLRKGSTSQAPAGNAKVAQMVQDQGSIHTVTKAMLEEVEAFNASNLEGKARKKYELQKRIELGAKTPKRNKIPLPILHGMKKKRDFETKVTRAREQEQGTYVKPKDTSDSDGGRKRSSEPQFNPGDKFRNGTAIVTSKPQKKPAFERSPEKSSFHGKKKTNSGRSAGKKPSFKR